MRARSVRTSLDGLVAVDRQGDGQRTARRRHRSADELLAGFSRRCAPASRRPRACRRCAGRRRSPRCLSGDAPTRRMSLPGSVRGRRRGLVASAAAGDDRSLVAAADASRLRRMPARPATASAEAPRWEQVLRAAGMPCVASDRAGALEVAVGDPQLTSCSMRSPACRSRAPRPRWLPRPARRPHGAHRHAPPALAAPGGLRWHHQPQRHPGHAARGARLLGLRRARRRDDRAARHADQAPILRRLRAPSPASTAFRACRSKRSTSPAARRCAATCSALRGTHLAGLDLEGCARLASLDGIAELPLKRLRPAGCKRLEDVSALSTLIGCSAWCARRRRRSRRWPTRRWAISIGKE